MTKSNLKELLFSTTHLLGDLKRLSIRGGVATFFGQGAKFVLNLGSTMILARLLTPQDFGLIAMVTAVTGFVLVFKDMGLSMATVRQAEISSGQVSTLFWINLLISVALTLITLALAPVISIFYNDSRLFAVTAALSTSFIFGGLTVQHQALLRRQMRLTVLASIDVITLAVGVLTAIILASSGLGYWALVWMQIVKEATNAAGVWIASGWRPGWPMRCSGVRSMLSFGSYLTGYTILNYFSRNLDNILLGRYWGPNTLGLYAKAYSLLLFSIAQVTAPMTSVAVPALSCLQNEPERFCNYYLRAVKIIAYITMPTVIVMVVFSNEIVLLVLGEQWVAAVPIFMILAASAVMEPVIASVGWIYIALGRSRRMLMYAGLAAPIRIISFIIGLRWGAIGVAAAYAIGTIILVYPTMIFSLNNTPVKPKQVFESIFLPLVISIIVGLTMAIFRTYLQDIGFGLFSTIVICMVSGGIIFLFLSRLLSPAWGDLTEIFATFRQIFDRK